MQTEVQTEETPVESKKPSKRLGLMLRDAREKKGWTAAECEKQLRIKETFLLALENGHYHLLPTATHAKGFLRSYAMYLGLAAKLPELQAKFAEETTALPAAPQLSMPAPLPEARLPGRMVAIGGIVAAVLFYMLYLAVNAPAEKTETHEALLAPEVAAPIPEQQPVTAPEAQMSTPSDAASAETVTPTSAPVVPVETANTVEEKAPEKIADKKADDKVTIPDKKSDAPVVPAPVLTADKKKPSAPVAAVTSTEIIAKPLAEIASAAETSRVPEHVAAGVVVRAVQDSWIQVQDEMGATIFSRLLHKDENYYPPDEKNLTLTVGNAAGIVIVRDGVIGKPLGDTAEVVRSVPLTKKKN